jgi:SAM-dependent methyltransferase
LAADTEQLRCANCTATYAVRNVKIYFSAPFGADDKLDAIKNRLKRVLGSSYYSVGITLLAPGFPFNYRAAIRRHIDPRDHLVVDIGCGNNRVDDDIVTVDATDYGAVDIVADIGALPFKDGSLDALCTRSVLEHVPEIGSAVSELSRCTRPGGLGIHVIPFLFPYHASPHDYTRLTHSGSAGLFRGWKVVEQRNTTGPVTLFLVCLLEFLSVLLSFGRPGPKAIIYLVLCLAVFPLKVFDAPFIGRRAFLGLAPTILTVSRKSGDP